MYRVVPVANKVIHRQLLEEQEKMHNAKIHNVKTQIDFSQPEKYKHLVFKMKKERIIEGIDVIQIDLLKLKIITEDSSETLSKLEEELIRGKVNQWPQIRKHSIIHTDRKHMTK